MDEATQDRATEVVLATAKIGGAILDTHEDALMTVLALEDAGIKLTISEETRARGSSSVSAWLQSAAADLGMGLDKNDNASVRAVLAEIDRRLGRA